MVSVHNAPETGREKNERVVMSKLQTLSIDVLRLDGGTQARVSTHEDTVEEYANLIDASDEWPFGPIDVFHDGTDFFVADGFHRTLAAQRQKRASIPCRVHKGTARDAKIFGMTANDTHGLRMTREDKRACVLWLIEQGGMTQEEMAAKAGVSRSTVARVVAENVSMTQSTSKTLGKASANKPKKAKKTEETFTDEEEETDVEITDETDDPFGTESDEPIFDEAPEVTPTGSKKEQAKAAKEAAKAKAKAEREQAKADRPVPGDTPEDQERNLRKMFADHIARAVRLADILHRTVPNARERDAVIKTLGGVKLWSRR